MTPSDHSGWTNVWRSRNVHTGGGPGGHQESALAPLGNKPARPRRSQTHTWPSSRAPGSPAQRNDRSGVHGAPGAHIQQQEGSTKRGVQNPSTTWPGKEQKTDTGYLQNCQEAKSKAREQPHTPAGTDRPGGANAYCGEARGQGDRPRGWLGEGKVTRAHKTQIP